MKNKVLVISAEEYCKNMESIINKELEQGWLIELFYEARGNSRNLIIITLYKEEKDTKNATRDV